MKNGESTSQATHELIFLVDERGIQFQSWLFCHAHKSYDTFEMSNIGTNSCSVTVAQELFWRTSMLMRWRKLGFVWIHARFISGCNWLWWWKHYGNDISGKIIWAKHNEIWTVNIRSVGTQNWSHCFAMVELICSLSWRSEECSRSSIPAHLPIRFHKKHCLVRALLS